MTDGMPFRSLFERFDAACSDTPLANNGRGQAERSEGKVEINARMHRIEYLHDMTHLPSANPDLWASCDKNLFTGASLSVEV